MKKKILKVKKKLNNAGMTLIEVLVAMALLVVAIIPLSGGYIYSAKHSAKAKHMQQATILAHTMIENCKAYSMKEIDKMIVTDKNFMPNTESDKHIKDTSVAGAYQYYFDDVVVYTDSVGTKSSQVYDLSMRIEALPSGERNILKYSNMNKYTDAVFVANQTMDSTNTFTADQCDVKAYEYGLGLIATKVNDYIDGNATCTHAPFTASDIEASMLPGGENAGEKLGMTRRIRIIPKWNGGTYQTVSVVYEYIYNFTATHFDFNDEVNLGTAHSVAISLSNKEYEFPIFDNSITGSNANLKSVYLFYYPSYNEAGLTFYRDEIVVNNQIDSEFDVYILKQERTDMTQPQILIKESAYNPKVTVEDSTKNINVFHNLAENLGGGATTGWVTAPAVPYITWQDFDSSASVIESLVGEEPKKLMYKVKVSIHPGDAYVTRPDGTIGMDKPALSSMDGTFLDW